ncbi:MAG: hypothetical protein M0R40_09805 [Firmicutes bacterium]|nr:hypothetical protein [Bacillota bacterium]
MKRRKKKTTTKKVAKRKPAKKVVRRKVTKKVAKRKPAKKAVRRKVTKVKSAKTFKPVPKTKRPKGENRPKYRPLPNAPDNEFRIHKNPRKTKQGETVFTVQINRKKRTLPKFLKAVALTDWQKMVKLRKKRGPGMMKVHVFSEYRGKLTVRQFVYRFQKFNKEVGEKFAEMFSEIFSGAMDYKKKKIWRNYVYSFRVRV